MIENREPFKRNAESTDRLRPVQLPEQLCEVLEQRFSGQYGSLDLFIQIVLEELLRSDPSRLDASEQRMVEDRLRDLGYM